VDKYLKKQQNPSFLQKSVSAKKYYASLTVFNNCRQIIMKSEKKWGISNAEDFENPQRLC